MVGLGLKEVLRSLCSPHGWSYGIFWRVADHGDTGLLTMGEAYHEECISMAIDNMLHRVHKIGEGIIGEAALSGKHQWIYSDACSMKWSVNSFSSNPDMFQTTAIISLLPVGVVQFGSTKKIIKSSAFIDQVICLFQQLQSMSGSFLYEYRQKAINNEIQDQCSLYTSVIRSGDFYSRFKNINAKQNYSWKAMMVKEQCAAVPFQSSSPALRSPNGNTPANAVVTPVTSSSTCSTKDLSDPSSQNKTPVMAKSFHFMNHSKDAAANAQVLLSSNTQWPHGILQINPSSDMNLVSSNQHRNVCSENFTLPSMEAGVLCVAGTQGFPSSYLPNLYPIVSHGNVSHHLCGDLNVNSPLTVSGSFDTHSNNESLEISKHSHQSEAKLLNIPDSSLFSTCIEGHLSSGISLSTGSHELDTESVGYLKYHGDFTPEHATLAFPKSSAVSNLTPLNAKPLEKENKNLTVPTDESLLGATSVSSGLDGDVDLATIKVSELPSRSVENSVTCTSSILVDELSGIHMENCITGMINSTFIDCDKKDYTSSVPAQTIQDIELFDGIDFDLGNNSQGQRCWDDIIMSFENGSSSNLIADVSECNPEFDLTTTTGPASGFFPDYYGLEGLLNAASVSNANPDTRHNSVVTIVNDAVEHKLENHFLATSGSENTRENGNHVPSMGLPCFNKSMDLLSGYNLENFFQGSQKEPLPKPRVSSWTDNGHCMKAESAVLAQPKKPEESVKVTKKRARPGESTRPRPKDRQLIQDRVKELREIVPNSAKCSIDALLDRTIKHMLFLQSITKYAEKLKEADEPKMIGEESGVVLKDNSSGGVGGATWAFEVAGQTMVCPIFVEELNPPGQMLVEMLCEEHGLFLEIADIIRGFGLTILRGIMEVRDSKIWARFLVEADRDVTRMKIFLSLVQLLQQTATNNTSSRGQPTKVIDSVVPNFTNYQQSPLPIPVSCSVGLQ